MDQKRMYVFQRLCDHLGVEIEVIQADVRQRDIARKRAMMYLFMTAYLDWTQVPVSEMMNVSRQALTEQAKKISTKLSTKKSIDNREVKDMWEGLIDFHRRSMNEDADYSAACIRHRKVDKTEVKTTIDKVLKKMNKRAKL